MSKIKHEVDVTVPHLALLTDETGTAIAIPPGANLFIIEDASRADGVFPLVLLAVSRKNLRFQCGCGIPKCTRTAEAVIKWKGKHPQKLAL